MNIDMKAATLAHNFIKSKLGVNIPKIALVLGSGLGDFIKGTHVVASIKYSDIPGFPNNNMSIVGHNHQLSLIELPNGKQILAMCGRFHYFEGYQAKQVALPIVVFALLGVEYLFVSNAAGGINATFTQGDLMLINDHMNFTGYNPLIGINNDTIGPRFLDQTECYNSQLIKMSHQIAKSLNMTLQEGVYMAVSGPTYETKSEINAFRVLGADAVGMSTVYEVITANYFKIKVLGISCITNMATGIANKKHNHEDVVATALATVDKFTILINNIIATL